MKKNILIIIGIGLLFISCENELVELQEESSDLFTTTSSSLSGTCEPDLWALELSLPETVTVSTKFAACSETGGAFISIDITEGELASINNDAYCVDLEGSISIPATYTYDVYSSYDNLSGLEQSPGIPLFENASDFDQINYLLNQDVIGTDSPLGGKYTFGHIQWAIWEIIEGAGNNCTNDCDYLSCNPINQWDTDKAYNESLGLELVALAAAGEGFVPQCGDKIAIVLASTTAQSLIITIDVPEKEVEKECDTAFAIGNNNDGGANDDTTCFIEDGINRWGWTIGPLSVGEYTYDVFAGAGQCDTNKGELVGTATVNYSSDGNVNVTYDISADYEVSETHTYAGKAMYPTTKKGKTNVAPGQFTIESNLSGDIYVILHSVVCK